MCFTFPALPDPIGVWPLNSRDPLADITGNGYNTATGQTVTIDADIGNYGDK